MTGFDPDANAVSFEPSHLLGAENLPLVPVEQLALDEAGNDALRVLPESVRQLVLRRLARENAFNFT
jgi:hypothetical protein